MVRAMPDRTPLPIDALLPQIAAALRDHGQAILRAPPGAGKTTRVAPSLLDADWLADAKIVMLEPRRLAARAAAHRMAEERGERVGETIGYRVRMETKVGPATRVEVVTEGVLTRMLQADPALSDIGLVIFDEFHERSLQADLGLALCRQARQLLRPDLRLLVMSATLDGAGLASLLDGAPVLTSEGRTHPVETVWLDRPAKGAIEGAVSDTIMAAMARADGGCLVFLPGRAEIARVARDLRQIGVAPDVDLLELYGDLALKDQARVIAPAPAGRRKLVLSTSIAETSLTLDGITSVVDSGLARRLMHDPQSGMDRLVTGRVSRAEADQRRGRAGRTGPGLCFRLWPKAEEGGLEPQAKPEILRADLTSLALELAVWGATPAELDWVDPPPAGAYAAARDLLVLLGALTDDGSVTDHGRAMAALPVHPRLAHMVVTARARGWGTTACSLAVLLAERDPMKGETDLTARLAQMASPSGPWSPLANLAKRLTRTARIDPKGTVEPRLAGALTALAYPDRIGQRRPGGAARYLLSGGRGATLARDDPLAAHPYLAVADLDGAAEARIYRAAPLAREDLDDLFAGRLRTVDVVTWDRRSERVIARRELKLDALVLEFDPLKDPSDERVAAALMAAARDKGLSLLPWTPASTQLRQRVRFLALFQPDDWPDWSDETLLATLDEWLAPHCLGMRRIDDLAKLDLSGILNTSLGWDRRTALDRMAPATISIPSGRDARIDYGDPSKPTLAVKLQEMFGARSLPRLADGRVPLVVHLLSPAGRPLAITDDLARFWATGYEAVRKDARGRYPKHPWPEDPTSAPATAATTRRSGRRSSAGRKAASS